MPGKRKQKRFSRVEAVKALARERIGSPPPQRVVPDKKKKREKPEKHKSTLSDLLGDST